ncbi:heptaprenylglyceryl phosphate synthase [Paenibacillus daejeonensis]|uniref:heptaprenylglyceryl phosphate synthase n=1 Tax=Paenibacillus daejeonensis TaxID=135193 RepID=UPI000372368C|nr:heptaprenylglyceryl phosphate synthase [Paenibacillus daejeonensis]
MYRERYEDWRHVFKLDPDREIDDELLDRLCLSGTDAIMVGGSSGVTFEKVVDLLARIRRYEVPCALEVSDLEAAVPGYDLYLIPMVLNTSRTEWLTGKQVEGLQAYGSYIPWENTAAEGYLILNPDAEAARLTGADCGLDAAAAMAHVRLADRLMRLPIVYVEYSGRFGDMKLVAQAAELVTQARLFYGGGIDSASKAAEAAAAAHTVIVGNVVYEDPEAALATVAAVRDTAFARN